MPVRSTTATGGNRAVIELSIPMRLVRGARAGEVEDSGDEVVCYICANSFCGAEDCQRTQTHLGCCTQSICCACLLKSSKRCTCKEDCDAVISLCPFCREVSSVEALDIFLGGKPPCATCRKTDESARATPSPEREEVIDLTGESSESDDDE